MQRIMNICSILLIALSLFAVTLGIAQVFTSALDRQTEKLRPQELIKSIGDVGTEEQVDATITLENPSSRMVTILGASRVCHPLCCVVFEGPPQRIPAHAQESVRLRLFAGKRTGGFQVPFTFYTDCDGQSEMTIELKGRVVAGSPVLTSAQR